MSLWKPKSHILCFQNDIILREICFILYFFKLLAVPDYWNKTLVFTLTPIGYTYLASLNLTLLTSLIIHEEN